MRGVPQAARRVEVRERILDATEALLARYGYRKMTVEDIARATGIGKGTVSLHFTCKQEVALCTVDRIVDRRLIEHLKTLASSDRPASEHLRSMLQARVLFRFDAVQHSSQRLNDLLQAVRPTLLERRQGYFVREAQLLEEVLREGRSRGELVFDDAADSAQLLLTATNSLLPFNLWPQELGDRRRLEEQVRRLSSLLVRGLQRGSKREEK